MSIAASANGHAPRSWLATNRRPPLFRPLGGEQLPPSTGAARTPRTRGTVHPGEYVSCRRWRSTTADQCPGPNSQYRPVLYVSGLLGVAATRLTRCPTKVRGHLIGSPFIVIPRGFWAKPAPSRRASLDRRVNRQGGVRSQARPRECKDRLPLNRASSYSEGLPVASFSITPWRNCNTAAKKEKAPRPNLVEQGRQY
jgi:hypothetical protein